MFYRDGKTLLCSIEIRFVTLYVFVCCNPKIAGRYQNGLSKTRTAGLEFHSPDLGISCWLF